MAPMFEREIEVASKAAQAAAAFALRVQKGIQAEDKEDLSPVTHADRECEQMISAALLDAFPSDGLLGEEGAAVPSASGRRWIIDPIDGTRDYVRGNPLWANLIALESGGEVVVGIVNLPALGYLYWASKGEGAYRNGERITTSSKKTAAASVLCVNGFNRFGEVPFRAALLEALPRFWAVRSLGGAPDAMLVASGQAELWIEPAAKIWDLASLQIIIEEAAGRLWDYAGRRSIQSGHCVAFAPGLEDEVRLLLGI